MADVEADLEIAASLVGPLDVALISLFLAVLGYWLYSKKKSTVADDYDLSGLKPIVPLVRTLSQQGSYINRMKKQGKQIAIFYGSQTGTAEEFANRLSKDALRYGLKAVVLDPEECDIEDLERVVSELDKALVVFVAATYGEGDPTDNAQEMFDWLQEDHELEGLNYAVFGLGNKTYEHFNSVGRFIDKRIQELGGSRLCEIGEGDDDANIEEDFVAWREKFWPDVCKFFDLKHDARTIRRSLTYGSFHEYRIEMVPDLKPEELFKGEITKLGSFDKQKGPYDAKNPFLSSVRVNRELHTGGDRSCMHVEFDITGSGIRYTAGDHVGVYPANDPELVEAIGKHLDIDLDDKFTMENIDEDAKRRTRFPCPTTFRIAFSHYIDIASVIKTSVLSELVEHTADSEDRRFLLQLVSGDEESKAMFHKWVSEDHRNIVSVLQDIPSCKPPIEVLLEFLPKLQCRYYSISSSSKKSPNRVHITAVLVDWDSKIGRKQKGVCTTFLKGKFPVEKTYPKVPIFVRRTQFRLPSKPTTPVIMVGPGTGLAPFRGFLQDRDADREKGAPIGDTVLFFGCRNKSEDYLYQEELEQYQQDGTISKLNVAFSRDQKEKVYVTDQLKENKELVWQLLEKSCHFYVCGDARHMAKDVHNILCNIVEEYGKMSTEAAENYVKTMSRKSRYSVDVWS